MAQTFHNPEFSFLKFSEGNTGNFDVIPIQDENDIKFQVAIDFESEAELATFMAATPVKLALVKQNGTINSNAQLLPLLLVNYGASYNQDPSVIQVGKKRVLIYWDQYFTDYASLIGASDCFRICLIVYDVAADRLKYFISNIVKRIDETKRTSVIEYSCDEDAYDFVYCNVVATNKFRLPLYISKPQLQDDESVYFRSDGTRKLLSSVTKKEYLGFTELLSEAWHDRIKMALSHDNVNIWSLRYSGGISKNGNYEIEWPDFMDYESAAAKFKVLATPYNWRNSNCANCLPWNCEVSIDITDIAAEDGPPQRPNILFGSAYTLTGTADHIVWEFSIDNGQTWNPVTEEPTPPGGGYQFYFNVGTIEESEKFILRATPYCENGEAGTEDTYSYPS